MAQQDVLDYIRKTPYNSNVNVVKGMLNADGGGGGGSSDCNAMLPKVTITLNINDITHIDMWCAYYLVDNNNGSLSYLNLGTPQSSQIIEGYVVPFTSETEILWAPYICANDNTYDGYYVQTLSNLVNCEEDENNPGSGQVFIIDPTKPASFTSNADYILY